MPFEMVAWTLGWVLGKVGDSVVKALTPSELSSRLSATIDSWANALPRNHSMDPAAIFDTSEPEPGPARRLLFNRITDSELPTEEEWFLALLERWGAVRAQPGELQPFFSLSEKDASDDLRILAGRLTSVCSGDEHMYRNATSGLGNRIRGWRDLKAILLVSDIEEPQRWRTSYLVRFHLNNSTVSSLLVSNLRVNVESVAKIALSSPLTPGAPVIEYDFDVFLLPNVGPVKLRAFGPNRFSLQPGETEFFKVEIHAEPGWDYLIRLTADTIRLDGAGKSEAQTPDFWVSFKGTT